MTKQLEDYIKELKAENDRLHTERDHAMWAFEQSSERFNNLASVFNDMNKMILKLLQGNSNQ